MNQSTFTSTNLKEITVGEIVAKNYNAAGVFRQYGLDFCCGGGITLDKACKEHNLNIDQIITELEKLNPDSITGQENFNAWEPDFLIDYIIQNHHNFVRRKTEEISAYAEKVAAVHGERHPENVEIYQKFNALSYEMMQHMEAEEEVVFPMIKVIVQKRKLGEEISEKEIEELKIQLGLMVGDHDGAGQLIKDIRELSHDFTPPQDACATYSILYQNLAGFEADLHKHVHLENNILFKKAEELIPA